MKHIVKGLIDWIPVDLLPWVRRRREREQIEARLEEVCEKPLTDDEK